MNKKEMEIFKYSAAALIAVIVIALIVKYVKRAKTNNQINNPGNTGIGGNLPAVILDEEKVLAEGVNGPETRALQTMLNEDGATPTLATDGLFGPLTKKALVAQTGVAIIRLREYKEMRTGNRTNGALTESFTPNQGGISA